MDYAKLRESASRTADGFGGMLCAVGLHDHRKPVWIGLPRCNRCGHIKARELRLMPFLQKHPMLAGTLMLFIFLVALKSSAPASLLLVLGAVTVIVAVAGAAHAVFFR